MEAFFNAWRVSISGELEGISGEAIRRNIDNIKALEAAKPGSVGFLNKEFGIFDFGRYPFKLLLQQYENRDREKPYGVIFYPRNDRNGAFYFNNIVFRKLLGQLKDRFEIRICEGDSKIDIVRFLHKLNRKYGGGNKISFAIIGGHGTRHSIKFGGMDPKHSIEIDDLYDRKHPASVIRRFFEDAPTFILNSCSTGKKESHSIAKDLSDTFKARVLAPPEDTNIKSIKVLFPKNETKDKKPIFEVEYEKEIPTTVYPAPEN